MVYLTRTVDLVNGDFVDTDFRTLKEAEYHLNNVITPSDTYCDMVIKISDLDYETTHTCDFLLDDFDLMDYDYEIIKRKSVKEVNQPKEKTITLTKSLTTMINLKKKDFELAKFRYFINNKREDLKIMFTLIDDIEVLEETIKSLK